MSRSHPDSSKSSRAPRAKRGIQPLDPLVFQRALLEHFDRHGRELPWRQNADPYRVWVSEVMLQQTRVETVRAFYLRWMQQFPDLDTLADAPLDAVLKAWEGMGYYARARNLHRGALIVREQYHGVLPRSYHELQALPGIGEYTAGAIASIAYGAATPAVDGNVKRVLCRLLDTDQLSATQLREHATRLISPDRAGDFNQAFMELGATICTPRTPHCEKCPVTPFCLAFRRGTQHARPARKRASPLPDRHFVLLVILDPQGNTLLHRRPQDGLLGGLWEFPTFQARRPAMFLRRLLRNSTARSKKLATLIHPFSHFRAHYAVHLCRVHKLPPTHSDFATKPWKDLAGLAMSAAQRRVYSQVLLSPESGRTA
ncbi:MAG: A/G-specific adenine glycosylase [Longimicrobiales bacterium]